MGPNHPGTNRDLANGPLGGYAGVLSPVPRLNSRHVNRSRSVTVTVTHPHFPLSLSPLAHFPPLYTHTLSPHLRAKMASRARRGALAELKRVRAGGKREQVDVSWPRVLRMKRPDEAC